MHSMTCLLCITVSLLDSLILKDRIVSTSTVDLHQVLVNDTSCTDIEVTYLRITHLTIRQTDIFARSLKSRVRIVCIEIIHVRSRSLSDNITHSLIADSPSIENHEKCFLCHKKLVFN